MKFNSNPINDNIRIALFKEPFESDLAFMSVKLVSLSVSVPALLMFSRSCSFLYSLLPKRITNISITKCKHIDKKSRTTDITHSASCWHPSVFNNFITSGILEKSIVKAAPPSTPSFRLTYSLIHNRIHCELLNRCKRLLVLLVL